MVNIPRSKTIKKGLAVFSFCLSTSFLSKCQDPSFSNLEILPLHPYSASPTDYDSTAVKAHDFVVKYFFIRGATKATDELSLKLDTFLTKAVRDDSINFATYGLYIVYFFKESDETNSNYRNKGTGDTPESHKDDDLLFEYRWNDQKFGACVYYHRGKVVKTVQAKSGVIFK